MNIALNGIKMSAFPLWSEVRLGFQPSPRGSQEGNNRRKMSVEINRD